MNKTIENVFFDAFKGGGVVDKCIDWMRYTYKLPLMKPIKGTEIVNAKWETYYNETLPKEINEATAAFDESVIMYMDSPLINEIEANLNECETEAEKERYLFSLLKPFGDYPGGCGIARIYNPKAEINRLNKDIGDLEIDRAYWETLPKDKQQQNVNGEPAGTPEEQIKACNDLIEARREQLDWVLFVNTQFCNLTGKYEEGAAWMKAGTVESCLSAFVRVYRMFADRLDALLLTYGIDLMKLQRDSGLYLKDRRLITDVDCYIGSIELAQKYIDALPQENKASNEETMDTLSDERADAQHLPGKLATPEAIKYWEKAKELNLVDDNYKWLKGKQLAACFAREMSLKLNLNKGRCCWKPFEIFWKMKAGCLRSNYNDIQKTGQNPSESNLIDDVFSS